MSDDDETPREGERRAHKKRERDTPLLISNHPKRKTQLQAYSMKLNQDKCVEVLVNFSECSLLAFLIFIALESLTFRVSIRIFFTSKGHV